MTTWLRQSTAGTVTMGPYVGTADGFTFGSAYSIAQADIRLSKNGAAFAQSNNSAGAAHMENGYYSVPLDATDTNTLGRLRVATVEGSALPVWRDFMVVPANVWDSYFGSDRLQVDVEEIGTDIIDANALKADAVTEIQSGLSTLNAAGVRTAIGLASANLDTQLDALPTNTELTTALASADDATLTAIAALNNLSAAQVNAEVDTAIADAALATAIDLATLASYVDTEVAAIKSKTDNLPAAPAATGDIPSANAVADAVLGRGVSNVQDSADVTSLAGLILAVFESAIVGTTWTIRKTGGSTFTTKTVTVDASADPIVGVT